MNDIRVYVAGPLNTSGLVPANVRNAAIAASELLDHGFIPFLPHTNVLWEMIVHREEAEWLEWDLKWLKACDAMLRLPGASRGADTEESAANTWGIPVFRDIESLLVWRAGKMVA